MSKRKERERRVAFSELCFLNAFCLEGINGQTKMILENEVNSIGDRNACRLHLMNHTRWHD